MSAAYNPQMRYSPDLPGPSQYQNYHAQPSYSPGSSLDPLGPAQYPAAPAAQPADLPTQHLGNSSIGGPRFVISIDYGTTYTGAAWAVVTNEPPAVGDINVVQTWPEGNDPKVPSLFTYSEVQGNQRWGFQIDHKANVIKLTKLKLQKHSRLETLEILKDYLDEAGDQQPGSRPALHLLKTPTETVLDYLTEVAKCVRRDIEGRRDPDILKHTPIDLIITHPGKWDAKARNASFRAAAQAFRSAMPDSPNRSWSFRLATEPEACAQYTMRDSEDAIHQLRRGECFVVVDAGGGTVDLVSYEVVSVEPNFQVKIATDVSSAPCGASCIDSFFLERFLPNQLGEAEYDKLLAYGNEGAPTRGGSHVILTHGEQEMLEQFQDIKHGFVGRDENGQEPPPNNILLPDGVGEEDDATRGIRNGSLAITCDQMEQMFYKSVNGTIDLISQQLGQLVGRPRVQAIFLSGGFSRSRFLHNKIQSLASGHGIQVLHGTDSWTAVAKGAVMMGLQIGYRWPPESESYRCPCHIGIVLAENFAIYAHGPAQKYTDSFDGKTRARDNVKWLVAKGDVVETSAPTIKTIKLVTRMSQPGHRPGTVTIVRSSHDGPRSPPGQLSQCTDLRPSSLNYTFSGLPSSQSERLWIPAPKNGTKGSEYYYMVLWLRISVSPNVLLVELFCEPPEPPGQTLSSPLRGSVPGSTPLASTKIDLN